MPAFVDRTNQVYGKLIAKRFERRTGKGVFWLCKCDCGNSIWVSSSNLSTGNSESCGCSKDGHPTHGLSKTVEYRCWKWMRKRCNNPNNKDYPRYGGRGIKICKRWNSFENFLKDMGPRPPGKYSIERKDVNKDYMPSNCIWASLIQQHRNMANSIRLTYKGETLQIHDWADRLGVPVSRLKGRYYNGWPVERILQG